MAIYFFPAVADPEAFTVLLGLKVVFDGGTGFFGSCLYADEPIILYEVLFPDFKVNFLPLL
jgi:hypothetical protein